MAEFTQDTLIKNVIAVKPSAAAVLERNGLGCASCLAAGLDTIASAAAAHDLDAAVLLGQLNSEGDEEQERES